MSIDQMTKPRAFICGAIRNVESSVDKVFLNIERIRTLFSDSHIIMSFDESHDKTLLKLAQQKQKYGDKMDIIINRNPLSSIRTENISNARNRIIEKMREMINVEDPVPYFIMMDMDNACESEANLDVIRRAIERSGEWDAISFNRPGYYDIWALSIKPFIYSCWGWCQGIQAVHVTRDYIVKLLKEVPPDQLLECQSAFGSFAIYKTDPFLKCTYDWRMPKQYMALADLEENHRKIGYFYPISPLDQQTDEPDCEHRAFHMEATAKYGARVRISPECVFNEPVLGHA